MSQNRSESEVADRDITSIHGSTKVGEGDSLLALNKRIEIHDKIMPTYYNYGDAIEGERIVCQFRRISKKGRVKDGG